MFILDYAHTGNIYWGEGENWDIIAKSSSLLKRGEGKKLVFPQLSTKFIIQYRT